LWSSRRPRFPGQIGRYPGLVVWWLALPRPPLVSERDGRRLTVRLVPRVRERLERLEAKLGVRTAADAVARARRESA
jgi:hypothetical protein